MHLPSRLPLALLLLLGACGGGGGGGGGVPPGTIVGDGGTVVTPPVVTPPVTTPPVTTPPDTGTPAPARGSLIGTATLVPVSVAGASLNTLDADTFTALLDTAQSGTSVITGKPSCAVTTYTLRYHTVGGNGEPTEASAAVMLPSGGPSVCTGTRPVMLYAHGTSLQKSADMANLSSTESRLIAAMFAGQGYIVVAPNYAGYAGSTLPYHSYLDAAQQSNDMIDALRAARLAFSTIGASPSSKLVVSGYSQGGYVALATQRAMQSAYAAEFTVAAAAGLSGPYALLDFGDAMFGGAPSFGSTAFLPMLINAGQHAQAGLYSAPGDIYEDPYAAGIEDLLPGVLGSSELASLGKLPAKALFAANSLPQNGAALDYFGAGNLVKTSYRSAYLVDVALHPCNTSSAAPLACAPAQALRKWLLKNDLRTYQPAVPLLLCGGNEDPVVPYRNTELTAAYFRSGKLSKTLEVVNVDSTPGLGDSYRTAKLGFAAAKLALRLNALNQNESPDQAIQSSYHAGLAAPACLRVARDFFQGQLTQ